jgi:hypothetical protein
MTLSWRTRRKVASNSRSTAMAVQVRLLVSAREGQTATGSISSSIRA